MKQFKSVMTATAALLLVAGCGGGGGGGGGGDGGVTGGGSTTASPLKITTTNATATAANAMASLDSEAPTSALDAATSVKSLATDHTGAGPLQVLRTALALPRPAMQASGVALKVAVNETVNCEQGGTVRISGDISTGDNLVAGDNFILVATACRMVVDGTSSTVDGTLSFSVRSGAAASTFPAQAEFTLRATDLRVVTSSASLSANGDLQASWTATSATRQQYVFTGTAFGSTLVENGVTRSATWRNFRQSIDIDGSQTTVSMQATVETLDTSLGASPVSYDISTPTPVVHSGGSSTGEVRVAGSQSTLLVRLTAPDGASLLVDANGDGVFEQTLTRRQVELRSL